MRLVIREGLAATTAGIAVGLLLAAWLSRTIAGALFGVTPFDPVAFAAAPLILLAVAWLACTVPARRAAADQPLQALRAD